MNSNRDFFSGTGMFHVVGKRVMLNHPSGAIACASVAC